jgi:hypothetical protein
VLSQQEVALSVAFMVHGHSSGFILAYLVIVNFNHGSAIEPSVSIHQ